jgi:hypothetical protein
MKRHLLPILALCVVLLAGTASSCAAVPAKSVANAYYMAYRSLLGLDSPTSRKLTPMTGDWHLYLDLTKTMMSEKDRERLVRLFTDYYGAYGVTVVLDTVRGLKEKGKLTGPNAITDGFMLIFSDQELTDTKLVTEVSKYNSGIGGEGATYTVEFIDGAWTITEKGHYFIS